MKRAGNVGTGRITRAFVMLALAAASTWCAAQETPAELVRPNIDYLLADDLGWNDVGFHGGVPRTPNLDRLAANGAMLNAFYAQPYSSQTRAAMLTGRYPVRVPEDPKSHQLVLFEVRGG